MNVQFKSGVQLPLEVWQHDHMRNIIRAAMIEAPKLVDDTLVVTSVSRYVGDGGKPFSYHQAGEEGRAVDFRTGLFGDSRDNIVWNPYFEGTTGTIVAATALDAYYAAERWSAKMRLRLGNEHDILYGVEQKHIDHLHAEHDRKKELGS